MEASSVVSAHHLSFLRRGLLLVGSERFRHPQEFFAVDFGIGKKAPHFFLRHQSNLADVVARFFLIVKLKSPRRPEMGDDKGSDV